MSDKTDPRAGVTTLAACPDCGWAKHRRPNWCQTPKWHDKTDPRLMRLDTALGGSADGFYIAADALLADLDAADRAAGVVRVDTRDEALVERLAAKVPWGFRPQRRYMIVKEVLAALREES